MLEVKEITVERGGRLLFEDLSFLLKQGEALHICGVNGSGKSSLIKVLTGLAFPLKGSVNWQGEKIEYVREAYCSKMLFIGHKAGINRSMTAEQNLDWYCALHGFSETAQHKKIAAFKYFGLYGFEDIASGKLSAGQQRRIVLCRLMLDKKPLWILDEPLVSLDAAGVSALESLMQTHLDNGGMIVFTSHQALNLDASCVKQVHLVCSDLQSERGA